MNHPSPTDIRLLLAEARTSWFLFVELQDQIHDNLIKLAPFSATVDLRMAYAMTIWPYMKVDWLRMVRCPK